MIKNRVACEICDKVPDSLSPRGWCLSCEGEFHEWRARLPIKCAALGDCPTPLSCRILKRCGLAEQRAEIESEIRTDPDLAHVHNAVGID